MLRLLNVWHDFVSDVRRHVFISDEGSIGLGHLHLRLFLVVRLGLVVWDDVWIGLGLPHLRLFLVVRLGLVVWLIHLLDEHLIFDTVCWRLLEHVDKVSLFHNPALSVL